MDIEEAVEVIDNKTSIESLADALEVAAALREVLRAEGIYLTIDDSRDDC